MDRGSSAADGSALRVEGLRKVFRVRRRAPGVGGALRSLFSRRYEDAPAVNGLSFQISRGERVAFVGPNGAGKSTTIKILTGILRPTSGEVSVLGLAPWRDRARLGYRIGTVFGQRSQLWYHLPAGDTFDLLARIYELEDEFYRRRRAELVERFAVGDLLDRPVRQLSLGQRMRCEVVASLLHQPEILFLDEPTIGLDVTAKSVIRDLLGETSREDGSTVLLTSHDTGDMEKVCDRVIVINHGALLLDSAVRELRGTFLRRKVVTLLTAEESIALALPGVEVVESEPYRIVLEVDTQETEIDAVVQAVLARTRLRDLSVEDPPMEEIVRTIYARARDPVVEGEVR